MQTTFDLLKLIDSHSRMGAIDTIATHARQVKVDLGVIHFDPDRQITDYSEKPSYHLHVSMGIYVFEPTILEYIPYNQYLDFPDLVLRLIAAGQRLISDPFEGYWQDLGRPDYYEQAVQDFDAIHPQILFEE